MSSIFGKALLVITRTHADGESARYDVSTYIQSCTDGIYDRDAAQEEFQHLEYDVHPLPSAAYKLAWGDTIRVAVTFYISFHKYWDGECDSTLEYTKQRVLRRQKYRPRYQTKQKGCAHLWIGWGTMQACELCNKFITVKE